MKTPNKIYAIVEGQGEANAPAKNENPAVVILINKLLQDLNCWSLFPAEKVPPFRMSYGSFFRDNKLERAIRLHKKFPDCAALLILLDMDDYCAKEKAFELTDRIRTMETLPFSVTVVCATREYETWFLAGLESIYPDHAYPDQPETLRNAKGWLRKHFDYKQTRDQAKYTRRLDISLTYSRSRSFRRLYHALQEIVDSSNSGELIITPIKPD